MKSIAIASSNSLLGMGNFIQNPNHNDDETKGEMIKVVRNDDSSDLCDIYIYKEWERFSVLLQLCLVDI
ncbi:hypothetical protein ACFXTH_004877 [Malus domestica]